jgi:predicted GIY-YIG superfamily endonuclease
MYYVYELINLVGTVEYVGMTKNAKRRMVSHKCKNGLFHKRQDIFMNIVKEFNDTKSCLQNACQNMGLNTGEAGRVARGGKLQHKGYYIKYK